MAALQQAAEDASTVGQQQLLQVFESVVVDQTKSFLQEVGKEFPIMNKFFSKIKDIPSIRKNISLIVLITYTSIFGKRPQGLELNVEGTEQKVSNLNILILSVLREGALEGQELNIDAATILCGRRGDAAMHIHALVKLLHQLLDMNAETGLDETYDPALEDNDNGGIGFDGVENQPPSAAAARLDAAGNGEFGSHHSAPLANTATVVSAARLRAAGKVDLVARMAEQAQSQSQKQRLAGLRRADKVNRRRQEARERNMRHRERRRMIKKLRHQEKLDRLHLGNQLRFEAEKRKNSNDLVEKVLQELAKDMREEDVMNAEYLQRLEQQRIAQAASTSALFSDRSEMIKQMTEEAEEYQNRMLKEQERFMEDVMREAEDKQKVNLEAKLRQLNMLEEECLAQSREAQISLAELFNVDTYKYVTADRVTGVPKSPFERTLRKIRSNALTLRQQQHKKLKSKKLKMAYNSKPFRE